MRLFPRVHICSGLNTTAQHDLTVVSVKTEDMSPRRDGWGENFIIDISESTAIVIGKSLEQGEKAVN